jgi:hypothetical protein
MKGEGVLRHRDQLADASSRAVVAPNNDTLYSSGWFDLCFGDLQLEVPAMDEPGRYWSVMLLDAFTHVNYVSRREYGVGGASVRLTYDPDTEHDPENRPDRIAIGTPTVWVLVRTLVDGPEDLARAQAIQQSFNVVTPPDHPTGRLEWPPGRPDRVAAAGAAFFDELRQALQIEPPAAWHPQLTAEQQDLLDNGADPEDLAAGVMLGNIRVRSLGFGAYQTRNGWRTRSKGTQFGDDVTSRAASAQMGLGGHHRIENSSYSAQLDNRDEPLDGSHPLTLHFPPGEEPPAGAFWSLTVYGPDRFFYDNPLNRYSLGDRTPGLKRDADGLKITIGGDQPDDTSNWLPAPSGSYQLGLRIYEGRQDVVDASWFPPPLERA